MEEEKEESESNVSSVSLGSLNFGSLKRLKSEVGYDIGECMLTVAHGDIVNFEADAIVKVSTEQLVHDINEQEDFVGIELAADINKACGPKLREACLQIKEVGPDCRCPPGEARITDAFDLKTATYIMHTVGPTYVKYDKKEARRLLLKSYASCLNLCVDNKIDRIAFPLISVGMLGFPVKEACEVALESITAVKKSQYPKEVYFIMQAKKHFTTFEALTMTKFDPKKTKAARSPFITKGSTFRMNKTQKVMLGMTKEKMSSFQELMPDQIVEEGDEDDNSDTDEKKD